MSRKYRHAKPEVMSPAGYWPQLHAAIEAGADSVYFGLKHFTARAKVVGNYEKKGHRFVEVDALIVANGKTPLAHCQHVAIYQPREQAAA